MTAAPQWLSTVLTGATRPGYNEPKGTLEAQRNEAPFGLLRFSVTRFGVARARRPGSRNPNPNAAKPFPAPGSLP